MQAADNAGLLTSKSAQRSEKRRIVLAGIELELPEVTEPPKTGLHPEAARAHHLQHFQRLQAGYVILGHTNTPPTIPQPLFSRPIATTGSSFELYRHRQLAGLCYIGTKLC
jgi:hypothetical protein